VNSVLMTTDAVGGVWRYSVDLAAALARRGITPTLAVMGPPPAPGQLDEAERAGLAIVHGNYRLEWMPDPWDDVDRAGQWLLELADTIQPDVIHLNGYTHAALQWSQPVLVVAHSCIRSWWRAVRHEAAPVSFRRYSNAVHAGLSAARLVVAPTAAMLSALECEYGTASDRRVIPNGCGLAAQLGQTDLANKEPIVFAAGRAWDDAKNLSALCAIADRLTWPVFVAGDRRRPDGIECALSSVCHLGTLSSQAIADWYRRASIYVLPARYEPFGLSILEAACAGCALVLGDIDSLRENWDGAAVFVPPDDRDSLAFVIQCLIDEPASREALARAARRRATAFTIDRAADAYVQAYEMLAV
jgi:glycogen synthase